MAEPQIKLIREDDDPICPRASIGGKPEVGYYCVFRGSQEEVIACVESVLAALKSGRPVQDARTVRK